MKPTDSAFLCVAWAGYLFNYSLINHQRELALLWFFFLAFWGAVMCKRAMDKQ